MIDDVLVTLVDSEGGRGSGGNATQKPLPAASGPPGLAHSTALPAVRKAEIASGGTATAARASGASGANSGGGGGSSSGGGGGGGGVSGGGDAGHPRFRSPNLLSPNPQPPTLGLRRISNHPVTSTRDIRKLLSNVSGLQSQSIMSRLGAVLLSFVCPTVMSMDTLDSDLMTTTQKIGAIITMDQCTIIMPEGADSVISSFTEKFRIALAGTEVRQW
jgi:hypothetical protein